MFAVVPTTAAAPTEAQLHTLAGTAKSVVDALRPHLDPLTPPKSTAVTISPTQSTQSASTGTTAVSLTIRKVVSCNAVYSALLRSDGRLLLLTSPPAAPAQVSVLESGSEEVVDVAAGASHVVYCTTSGAVYTCGYDNTYGQLGDGSVWSAEVCEGAGADTAVPVMRSPRRIHCFGAPLSESTEEIGELLGSGTDCRVAIGLALPTSSLAASGASAADDTASAAGGASTHGATPATASWRRAPPPADRHIVQVACGAQHTLILTQSGRCVYACGTGEHGQLGGSRPVLVQPSFRAIPLLFGHDMAQVAAAAAHSFVLLRNGLLYAFGDNACGQLGLGHTRRVIRPTVVPLTADQGLELTQGAQPAGTASASGGPQRRLDQKTYASLRAPYASTESTYYPLRVPRLQADTKGHDAGAAAGDDDFESSANAFAATTRFSGKERDFELLSANVRVVRVYCCVSWTLLETTSTEVWLSCGAPLTRGLGPNPPAAPGATLARIDGCGVLGRPLRHSKAEAYVFQPVLWASTLSGLRLGSDATVTALGTPPVWAKEEQHFFTVGAFGSTADSVSDPLQQSSLRVQPQASFSAADDVPRTPAETAAPAAWHRASADSRISDTEASLFHATKATEKTIMHVSDISVNAYATSLLLALLSSRTGEVSRDSVVTSIVIQSGGRAPTALEVRGHRASTVRPIAAVPSHTSARKLAVSAGSCGTSVVQVYSSRGIVIPLPAYALVL